MKLPMTTIEAKMKIARLFLGLTAAALLLTAAACAPTTLEQDYGRSVRHNVAQSLVNPQACLDTTPAVGLSPTAAANAMERYNKTFKGEEKKTLEMKLTTPSY